MAKSCVGKKFVKGKKKLFEDFYHERVKMYSKRAAMKMKKLRLNVG